VPVALLPLFADQPANARRVDETGAGLLLEGGPPALAGLGGALTELIGDPRYAAAAGGIRDEIAALPHVDEAAGALAGLAAPIRASR
jgi:UDP:flavonoid glycosyltransferase YjiC (YdhE family)